MPNNIFVLLGCVGVCGYVFVPVFYFTSSSSGQGGSTLTSLHHISCFQYSIAITIGLGLQCLLKPKLNININRFYRVQT